MVNSQYKYILKHRPPCEIDSPEYEKGLKYIESWKTYIKPNESLESYENLEIEKEAYEKSELAAILYYSIMQNKF